MTKVILVCGKICAGKTTYAKKLAEEIGAVILSVDEITLVLFGQHLGDKHDEMVEKTEKYLFGKAAEIISVGVNVILDWGFWTREERQYAVKYFSDLGIKSEWHYIDTTDRVWHKNLSKRNKAITENTENFYFIDDNIAEKFWNLFEEPAHREMDVWYQNNWT
jgi:Predicted kinase